VESDARPSVLLSRRWPASVENALRERYTVTTNEADIPLSKSQFIEAMHRYDAICPTVTDRIDADILRQPNARVKIVGNYGAGIEHVDLEAARAAGIAVTNTPDVLTQSTAELALLLMLMTSRRAGEGERELRSMAWTGWRPTHLLGTSLAGKRLGLVGFGRIARATARLARAALGMEIAYFSRRRAEDEDPGAIYMASLEDLLATSDVVSLHCPGGPETRHLINAERLALMKPTAIIVNTARGSVIDEGDLALALAARTIAAAGLDVYEREPTVDPRLAALDNAVLLPHLGSATIETRTAMGHAVMANLERFFSGRPLLNPVA